MSGRDKLPELDPREPGIYRRIIETAARVRAERRAEADRNWAERRAETERWLANLRAREECAPDN